MSYGGLMDSWCDEYEEHGKYCFCRECEQIRDNEEDLAYEQYKYEQDDE